MANDLEPVIGKVVDQIGKLTLVAYRDGQVMECPIPETVGQWLKPGRPFCEVGDPRQLEAHMILDQGDIDLVKLGRRTWLKVYGDSGNDLQEPCRRNLQAEQRGDLAQPRTWPVVRLRPSKIPRPTRPSP